MPAFYVDTTTAPKNKWISPEKHELDEMIEMPPRGVLQEARCSGFRLANHAAHRARCPRAERLLRDFPTGVDVARLVAFAPKALILSGEPAWLARSDLTGREISGPFFER